MAEAVLPANSVGIWAFGPSVTIYGVPIYRTVVEEGPAYGACTPTASTTTPTRGSIPPTPAVMKRLSELAADADDPEIDGIARL